MSFWKKMFRAGGAANARAGRPGCCLIDGNAWLNLHGSARADPRDMIGVLQRVGRWAKREALRVEVVFDGEPLRKTADGESFSGVRVRFAEDRDRLAEAVRAGARSAHREGCDVVLVTSNADLIQDAPSLHAGCIRPATMRKAMEGTGGDDRPDRGARGGGSSRRRRGGNRRPRPSGGSEKASKPEADPAQDAVRTLIDVVD